MRRRIFLIVSLAVAPLGVHAEGRPAFCDRNPDARICRSAPEAHRDANAEMETECKRHPNTQECKDRAVRKKVQDERLAYCDKNPKACAARRR